jgi:FkbM family methyltransferase
MLRSVVGLSMRAYRASPFYPRLGKSLAKVLALTTRWRGNKSVVHTVNGITFELDLSEVIDASLYYSGTFEASAEQAIANCVKPGMIAIDVGANIGYHTFALAKLAGPAGCVFAIEPTTRAFNQLKRNAELNDFKNITFIKVGLGDKELGEVEINFQSSYRLDGSREEGKERVVLTTLDSVVREQNLARVDFLKVDVDGFEGKVFRGAAETLRRCRPRMLFELTPAAMKANGDDPLELMNKLRALGYEFTTESGQPITDLEMLCAKPAKSGSVNLIAS